MPQKSLSHGTLGLKFMNRSSAIVVPPPPGPSTSKTAQPKLVAKGEDNPEWVLPGFALTQPSSSSGNSAVLEVEVEGSYLPFLLGAREDKEQDAQWRATSGKGGRRSFGGLNKDVEKLSLPPPAPAPPPAAPPAADEPPSSAFKHSKDLTMIDSPSSSSSALLSQPTQAHKPHVAASIAAETIIFNAPAHIGLGQPKGHGSFMKPKGFEVAPPSSSKSKSKKRKSGEVEPAAGGGLLRLGELGLAELVGDKGVGAGEEEEKKKHGRKNKDRKRARKEAEMRGGG